MAGPVSGTPLPPSTLPVPPTLTKAEGFVNAVMFPGSASGCAQDSAATVAPLTAVCQQRRTKPLELTFFGGRALGYWPRVHAVSLGQPHHTRFPSWMRRYYHPGVRCPSPPPWRLSGGLRLAERMLGGRLGRFLGCRRRQLPPTGTWGRYFRAGSWMSDTTDNARGQGHPDPPQDKADRRARVDDGTWSLDSDWLSASSFDTDDEVTCFPMSQPVQGGRSPRKTSEDEPSRLTRSRGTPYEAGCPTGPYESEGARCRTRFAAVEVQYIKARCAQGQAGLV